MGAANKLDGMVPPLAHATYIRNTHRKKQEGLYPMRTFVNPFIVENAFGSHLHGVISSTVYGLNLYVIAPDGVFSARMRCT